MTIYRKILLASMFMAFICSLFGQNAIVTLTEKETLELTKGKATDASVWHLYRKANPKVKDKLWEYIYDEEKASGSDFYIPGAIYCIAYMADKEDFAKLQAFLLETFKNKTISSIDDGPSIMQAVCYAFGIMATDKVPEAKEYLSEMLEMAFWEKHKIIYNDNEKKEGREFRRILILLAPFDGYAICSTDKEFALLEKKIKDTFKDDKGAYELVEHYLNCKKAKERVKYVLRGEPEPDQYSKMRNSPESNLPVKKQNGRAVKRNHNTVNTVNEKQENAIIDQKSLL